MRRATSAQIVLAVETAAHTILSSQPVGTTHSGPEEILAWLSNSATARRDRQQVELCVLRSPTALPVMRERIQRRHREAQVFASSNVVVVYRRKRGAKDRAAAIQAALEAF